MALWRISDPERKGVTITGCRARRGRQGGV